jgi:hypothetical protein
MRNDNALGTGLIVSLFEKRHNKTRPQCVMGYDLE